MGDVLFRASLWLETQHHIMCGGLYCIGKNDGFIHIQYIRAEEHVHMHVSVVDEAAWESIERAVLSVVFRFLVSRRWLNQNLTCNNRLKLLSNVNKEVSLYASRSIWCVVLSANFTSCPSTCLEHVSRSTNRNLTDARRPSRLVLTKDGIDIHLSGQSNSASLAGGRVLFSTQPHP